MSSPPSRAEREMAHMPLLACALCSASLLHSYVVRNPFHQEWCHPQWAGPLPCQSTVETAHTHMPTVLPFSSATLFPGHPRHCRGRETLQDGLYCCFLLPTTQECQGGKDRATCLRCSVVERPWWGGGGGPHCSFLLADSA